MRQGQTAGNAASHREDCEPSRAERVKAEANAKVEELAGGIRYPGRFPLDPDFPPLPLIEGERSLLQYDILLRASEGWRFRPEGRR